VLSGSTDAMMFEQSSVFENSLLAGGMLCADVWALWWEGGFTTEITEGHRGREGHVWLGKRTVFAGSRLPDLKAAAGCAHSMAWFGLGMQSG
jgi:hypothetical protein